MSSTRTQPRDTDSACDPHRRVHKQSGDAPEQMSGTTETQRERTGTKLDVSAARRTSELLKFDFVLNLHFCLSTKFLSFLAKNEHSFVAGAVRRPHLRLRLTEDISPGPGSSPAAWEREKTPAEVSVARTSASGASLICLSTRRLD